MAKKEAVHPAVKALRAFQREMNCWEWEMIKEDFSDLEHLPAAKIDALVDKRRERSRAKLRSIFERHCEAGAKARRVDDVLHYGGDEPDYNPETEKVLSIQEKAGKVIVETQMAHNFRFRLKYELVESNGQWLLRDNRKCKGDFNDKWKRWDL
jgi:hypothetical protein